jgi:hypothetical protein
VQNIACLHDAGTFGSCVAPHLRREDVFCHTEEGERDACVDVVDATLTSRLRLAGLAGTGVGRQEAQVVNCFIVPESKAIPLSLRK